MAQVPNAALPAPPRKLRLSPPQFIVLSFAGMILAGAALLSLPIASRSGESVGFLNALFTATSANCVTGLVVVNTQASWTLFGHIVILLLIQLGGLGLVALLTVGMVALRRRISLRDRLIIQAAFNQEGIGGMVRLVRRVLLTTCLFEGVGAVVLAVAFFASGAASLGKSLWWGLFHSISAFCNAGFDIVGPGSLTPFVGNWVINLAVMLLIICGGLGFTVWNELADNATQHKKRPLWLRWAHLSLHARLALTVTAALVFLGALSFLILEWNNPATLGPMPFGQKLLAALFQSVTLRTAGFNTISQAGLTEPSQMISCVWMVIGGSPAGTAGGIKTVTLAVILAAMLSGLRGRRDIETFGRRLPLDLLQKALTVTCTLVLVVFTATLLLHFTESGSPQPHNLMDLLFETSSAVGTVGITTGLTPYLSSGGKIIITLCMFLGRLSPATAVMALNLRASQTGTGITYPSERVIIG